MILEKLSSGYSVLFMNIEWSLIPVTIPFTFLFSVPLKVYVTLCPVFMMKIFEGLDFLVRRRILLPGCATAAWIVMQTRRTRAEDFIVVGFGNVTINYEEP